LTIVENIDKKIKGVIYMDEINNVINTFLEPFISDKNIQAAILTGSYA
jgi:hypothetical protein